MRIHLGCWNIHGLAEYKQAELLRAAAARRLDVLALCETHLVHEEELADWEKEVQQHDRFVWFGRPAARLLLPQPQETRGRGSGGVGLLVRRDWLPYLTVLPPCEQDCLVFVRLGIPSASVAVVLACIYLAPAGSARFAGNAKLMEELEERTTQYRSEGLMVCVMGDCNVHIANCPSTIIHSEANPSDGMLMAENAPVDEERGLGRILERRSTDQREPAAGAAFIDRMDAVGLIVLNGLAAVGHGSPASPTFGATASSISSW